MSDMECPFCKEEIISDVCLMFDKKDIDFTNGRQIYKCNKCGLFGTKGLWQELIRTRKALDVAVDALKLFDSGQYTPQPDSYGLKTDASRLARKALEQITALEQKDHFADVSKMIEQKDVK